MPEPAKEVFKPLVLGLASDEIGLCELIANEIETL